MNLDLGQKMESEIRQQTAVLASANYEPGLRSFLAGREFNMILIAARGSSDNAAVYGRYLFEIGLGVPVSLAAPSVLTRYNRSVRYSNCLAIGISQSGAAPDVAEVLAELRRTGNTTLAITNTADSRLSHEAEYTVLLNAGPETSVAATKTYSSSLLALYSVARALGADLPVFSPPTAEWVDAVGKLSLHSAGVVLRCEPNFALARGYGYCTALETALKLTECALIPCKPYSVADFEHGPKALAGPNSAAVCFNAALSDLAAQGCVVINAPEPPVVEPMQPIWDVIYGQWLALHCARALSLDPDSPRNLKKVTETR